MGKKRLTRQNSIKEDVLDAIKIIEKEDGRIFYEIEENITQDVAEAVSLMMRNPRVDKSIWKKELNIDLDTVDCRKCLYWLTGGDKEWIKLTNYSKPWNECDQLFVDEFEFVIRWILKKSKTLSEIRNSFIEHLNLHVLYEFALSKNIVK
jgi:hypothetical protein